MSKNENKGKTTSVETLLSLLARGGYIADTGIADKTARARQQKKQRNSYHNTELLLKQYRTIAWLLECFPDTIAEELEQPFESVDKMIEKLDVDMSMGNRKLENRIEGIRKTRMVIDRINEALTVLKKKPDDGERLYELIYLTYIGPEVLNHNDLLYRLNVSSRHYYRLREQAISILSIRLWSAPNKEIDFWLDILSAIEE